jgi:hypothetical protein
VRRILVGIPKPNRRELSKGRWTAQRYAILVLKHMGFVIAANGRCHSLKPLDYSTETTDVSVPIESGPFDAEQIMVMLSYDAEIIEQAKKPMGVRA